MEAWKTAEQIIKKFNQAGYEAYFVGGCVRDKLLGKQPADIDIATAAIPGEIKALFSKTVDTGIKHGTVTVLENGQAFEVTTFRRESNYAGHRRPEKVMFVQDIAEDLRRRDFTINAIAYHPDGRWIDPFKGREDLRAGIIRCVGDASCRFREDALRMLRCIRFACQTGFDIEEKTLKAIKEHKALLAYISRERIYDELVKCVLGQYPLKFELCYKTGLLAFFLPQLAKCFETPQHTKYHLYDVGNHILHAVAASRRDKTVRLAALLHDIGKPLCKTTDEKGVDHFYGHEQKSAEIADEVLKQLRAENKLRSCVVSIIAQHRWEKEPDKISVKEKIQIVGVRNFPILLDLMEADTAAHNPEQTRTRVLRMQRIRQIYEEILKNNEPLTVRDLKINGKDLLKAGYNGKEIGEALKALLQDVLRNPQWNEYDILLERLKKK